MSPEPSCVWFSASASTWNLFFSCSMKAVFTLRSRSFSTSKCCRPLGLDPVFLSVSFSVAVTKWWSLHTLGGPVDRASLDLYPSTCPAWVALPGDEAPTGIALGVSEALKLADHDKVAILRGLNLLVAW